MPVTITHKPKAATTPEAIEATTVGVPPEAPQPPAEEATPEKTARKKLVVEINAETHKNLRRYALDQDKTLTDVVNDLLTTAVRDAGYR